MTSGDMLREKRESLGLTLEAAEEATKIRRKYLEALEHEDYEELPGRVYAKAFLRTYAKYLGLDTDVLLSEFEVRYPSAPPEMESRPPAVSTPRKRPAYLRVLLVVAVIAGLFAFNAIYGGDEPDTPDPAPPQAPISDREDPGESSETGLEANDPVVVDPVAEERTPDTVDVTLVVTNGPSWVRVAVDGVQEFEGTASPGETLDFTGREAVSFRVGNAGVVELHLNGENLGLVGDYGAVAEREFTVEEVEE